MKDLACCIATRRLYSGSRVLARVKTSSLKQRNLSTRTVIRTPLDPVLESGGLRSIHIDTRLFHFSLSYF